MTGALANELLTEVVVRTGPGVGVRADEEEEVVHLSLQFVTGSRAQGIIQSQDQFEPSCFHHSRRRGLELAMARQSEIASLGFGGPSVALRVPGIPFAQEQDAGLHISLYNQPKQDGVDYNPPHKDKCKAIAGRQFKLVLDGTLKILNGNERNDLMVGGCYYVSLGCGKQATSIANDIKASVGLPQDDAQEFHLSLATIAPIWLPCHPKSEVALEATAEEKTMWQEKIRIFRHGNGARFSGFNDDRSTNWSTHATKMADAGKVNTAIMAKIDAVCKSGGGESEKQELQSKLIDIPREIGFCKTVGQRESILRISMPDVDAQLELNRQFSSNDTAAGT